MVNAVQVFSSNEDETMALAARIAKASYPGLFIALYGDLGVGKTVFARGFAREFGIEHLTSPTFTIVCEYGALLHFDAYRLSGAQELCDIGFEEYLVSGRRILMEWPENVSDALPEERLEIRFTGSGDERRSISLCALGYRAAKALSEAMA